MSKPKNTVSRDQIGAITEKTSFVSLSFSSLFFSTESLKRFSSNRILEHEKYSQIFSILTEKKEEMAGPSTTSNAPKQRKRVEAETSSNTSTTLRRAKDGSAFALW